MYNFTFLYILHLTKSGHFNKEFLNVCGKCKLLKTNKFLFQICYIKKYLCQIFRSFNRWFTVYTIILTIISQ